MKNRGVQVAICVFSLITLVLFSFGCKAPTPTPAPTPTFPEVFKFGYLGAMTGFGAYWGKCQSQAQTLAIEEINASGELPFKLVMVVGDHQSDDPKAGLNAARKMISIDKVPWINSSWTATTVAVQAIAAENHVVEMNAGGSAGASLLNKPWLHNFRLNMTQLIPPVVEYLVKDLGWKTTAITFRNESSGFDWSRISAEVVESLGAKVLFNEPYESGEQEFRSLIAKMLATNPEGLMLWVDGVESGYLFKQLREMNKEIPAAAMDVDPNALEIAGDACEGIYFGGDYWYPASNEWAQALAKNYPARWNGEKVDLFVANYYELVYVMKDCIQHVLDKGGDPFDGEQLHDALMTIRKFRTVLTGKRTMEALDNGACLKPVLVFRAGPEGERKVLKTIEHPEFWEKQ